MTGRILKDRYEIEEIVGEGGMATVYRARDNLLNRPVALKLMHRELCSDPAFVERFKREAEATAALSHPHIATIYDFGEQNGDHFIIMEYLPSKNLKQLIQERGPLPPKIALEIAIQVCDALKYAHSNGIIHRDIKPQNILFTSEGQVKITDFGIARALSSSTPLTGTGQLVGSVHYMSPEQAKGLEASERSDLYALGVLLFEMLTGKPLFEADSPVAVAVKHIQEQPPPIREINPSLPSSLEYIVSKALRKDATARYQTAHQFTQDLLKIKEERPLVTAAHRDSSPTVVPERSKRRPTPPPSAEPLIAPMTWVLVIITVLVVGGAAIYVSIHSHIPATSAIKIEVPDLVKLDLESAKQIAGASGLYLRVQGREQDPDTFRDAILRQSPSPGTLLSKNSAIDVIVSSGPGKIKVPDVVGMALDHAQRRLVNAGFRIGQIDHKKTEQFQRDWVVEQIPAPGTKLEPDSPIDLIISAGPESTEEPLEPVISITEPEEKEPPETTVGPVRRPTKPPSATVEMSCQSTSEEDETGGEKQIQVFVSVPNDGKTHNIRILKKDDQGEEKHELSMESGESVEKQFQAKGGVTVTVYENGKQIASREF